MENIKKFMKDVIKYKLEISDNNKKKIIHHKSKSFRNFIDYYNFDKFNYKNIHIFFGSPYIEKDVLLYITKINYRNITNNSNNIILKKLNKYHLIKLSGNRYQYYSYYELKEML